jgi:hypothetical protein
MLWQESWSIALAGGAAAFLVVLLMAAVWRLLRRRRRDGDEEPELASIDIGALEPRGPAAHGPQLTLYGTPVRWVLLVLAPVGRDGRLPAPEQIPDLVEQLIPGLQSVWRTHAPEIVCWPGQLSSQGFVRSFFHHMRLPGDRGRQTPWSSVAGKFRAHATPYLAGLVLCAAQNNSLGQLEIQHEGQWNDVLRIRE